MFFNRSYKFVQVDQDWNWNNASWLPDVTSRLWYFRDSLKRGNLDSNSKAALMGIFTELEWILSTKTRQEKGISDRIDSIREHLEKIHWIVSPESENLLQMMSSIKKWKSNILPDFNELLINNFEHLWNIFWYIADAIDHSPSGDAQQDLDFYLKIVSTLISQTSSYLLGISPIHDFYFRDNYDDYVHFLDPNKIQQIPAFFRNRIVVLHEKNIWLSIAYEQILSCIPSDTLWIDKFIWDISHIRRQLSFLKEWIIINFNQSEMIQIGLDLYQLCNDHAVAMHSGDAKIRDWIDTSWLTKNASPYTEATIKKFTDMMRALVTWEYEDKSIIRNDLKESYGDPSKVSIMKNIFHHIDLLLLGIDNWDNVSPIIIQIQILKKEFNESKAKSKKSGPDSNQSESTYHFDLEFSPHGEITGTQETTTIKPPKTIWKTIDEIRERVNSIAHIDESDVPFLKLFPWMDSSLEWNILILWPYGTGKTAFLRELAYDDSIVTINVVASRLKSQWFWVFEKNIPLLFDAAQAKANETWKHVFLLLDEFDQIMNTWNSIWGNQSSEIVKTFQVLLDWVQAYPMVHLIWLTNEPKAIPPAIIRRMNSLVTAKLSDEEKIELIKSRFETLPLDDDLIRNIIKKCSNFTPKMIAFICEKAFKYYIECLKRQLWEDKFKDVSLLLKNSTTQDEKKKIMQDTQSPIWELHLLHWIQALTNDPTTSMQLETYNLFYKYLEDIGVYKPQIYKK